MMLAHPAGRRRNMIHGGPHGGDQSPSVPVLCLRPDSALPGAVIGNMSGKNSMPTTPATLPPDTPEPPDNRTRARILPASCSHRAPETAVRAVEYCRRSRRFAVFAEFFA
jgi:hypothetical protein